MGEARLLEQLQALIEQLDVRQPQVMLEVLLVSLNEGQTLDLGIELEKIDLDPALSWRLSSLFGLSGRSGGNIAAGGAGLTGVVLNPGDFSVVLRALQTIQDGRSLSMPRVLVGNNQAASLDSVLEQPFTSTNLVNTGSSTSYAGSLPAGTQVSITPQIAEGDHLTLQYQVSLSSFTGAASGPGVPPPRQQNRVQSVATIPDGFTVVVGGIDVETDGKSVSRSRCWATSRSSVRRSRAGGRTPAASVSTCLSARACCAPAGSRISSTCRGSRRQISKLMTGSPKWSQG